MTLVSVKCVFGSSSSETGGCLGGLNFRSEMGDGNSVSFCQF